MPLCYLYFLYFVDVYFIYYTSRKQKHNKKEKTKEKRRLWFVIFIGPYNYIRFLYTIITYYYIRKSCAFHKYEFEDSESWQNFQEEEEEAAKKYVLKPLIGVPSSFYDRDFACFEKQKFGQIRFTKSDPAMISYYITSSRGLAQKKWFAHLHKKKLPGKKNIEGYI